MDTITTNQNRAVDTDSMEKVSRGIRSWLNSCPDIPCTVGMEYLTASESLCISVVETPYKTRQYITGGFQAQYDFDIWYRVYPANDNERLAADETLDKIAYWATHEELPAIEGVSAVRMTRGGLATLRARYEDGGEDHAVRLSFLYEVS